MKEAKSEEVVPQDFHRGPPVKLSVLKDKPACAFLKL